jgi:hypothetical protein
MAIADIISAAYLYEIDRWHFCALQPRRKQSCPSRLFSPFQRAELGIEIVTTAFAAADSFDGYGLQTGIVTVRTRDAPGHVSQAFQAAVVPGQ